MATTAGSPTSTTPFTIGKLRSPTCDAGGAPGSATHAAPAAVSAAAISETPANIHDEVRRRRTERSYQRGGKAPKTAITGAYSGAKVASRRPFLHNAEQNAT